MGFPRGVTPERRAQLAVLHQARIGGRGGGGEGRAERRAVVAPLTSTLTAEERTARFVRITAEREEREERERRERKARQPEPEPGP